MSLTALIIEQIGAVRPMEDYHCNSANCTSGQH